MKQCGFCGSTVVLGGKRDGDRVYCNAKCFEKALQLSLMEQIPDAVAKQYVEAIHSGKCPKCKGAGPVDVHVSHMVWSLLVLTRWGSKPEICCRKCGIKRKLGYALFSFVCGWWGFPWGLILTPIQVGRNIVGLFQSPDPSKPSKQLETMLRLDLATRLMAEKHKQSAIPNTGNAK